MQRLRGATSEGCRGLLTVMTLPSKALSESAAEFARMEVGYVRPLPEEPLAPPPHVVCAPVSLKARREVSRAGLVYDAPPGQLSGYWPGV